MVANKDVNRLVEKGDLAHILILLAIALGVGIYLIATTVLIAKDGVYYIERAQRFASDPVGVIKGHSFGFPFLIFAAHKIVSLFTAGGSIYAWIYSAQSITLLCRLLSLVPLYYIGKMLVGSRGSFQGLLILTVLPYPSKTSCEVLREWPYILFLAGGFLFLLAGVKRGKWAAFGLVGLLAGLGYMIRPMSAQLIVYGFIWLMLCMFRPRLCGLSKGKILIALVLLFIGFAIPVAPYMKCTGKFIDPKVNSIIKSFSRNTQPDETYRSQDNTVSTSCYVAEMGLRDIIKSLGEIFKTISENLMWVFVPALLVGLHCCFRQEANYEERFLIAAFILVNITAMVLRYCYIQLTVSKRWSLPLITLTVFYLPVGLRAIGNWFECKFPINKQKTDTSKETRAWWFSILLLIGICICLPKLLRPIRIEKQGYRDAAEWLRGNTDTKDIIAVPDRRISFYAERKEVLFGEKVPKRAGYIVKIMNREDKELNPGRAVKEQYSVWVDERKKRKKLVIYKVL